MESGQFSEFGGRLKAIEGPIVDSGALWLYFTQFYVMFDAILRNLTLFYDMAVSLLFQGLEKQKNGSSSSSL